MDLNWNCTCGIVPRGWVVVLHLDVHFDFVDAVHGQPSSCSCRDRRCHGYGCLRIRPSRRSTATGDDDDDDSRVDGGRCR